MSIIYNPSPIIKTGVTEQYVKNKLYPIQAVLNSATSSNIANTIIKRDSNNEFSASSLALSNNLNCQYLTANEANVNVVDSFGSSLSMGPICANINIGTSSGAQTVNIGTGSGATFINLGGSGDTVAIAGTLTTINTTNLAVSDKIATLNKAGLSSSGFNAGVEIEENGVITGYARTNSDRTTWQLKAPANANIMSINQSIATTDNVNFANITSSGDINIATSGKKLLMQGLRAFDATNTTTQSTYMGLNSGGASSTGVQNTCVGQASGGNLTSGAQNASVGMNCLLNTTTGSFNSGVGFICLRNVTTGSQNSSLGCNCLPNLSTGMRNIAMGESCGTSLTTGSNNIILGYGAFCSSASSNTITIGSGAGVNTDNAVQIGNASNDQFTLGSASASVLNCGSIKLASSGATSVALDHYSTTTHSSTFIGPYTTAMLNLYVTRVGKMITITSNDVTASASVSSSFFTITTALPAAYRPSVYTQVPIIIQQDTTLETGILDITTAGLMYIKRLNGIFTAGTAGFRNICVTFSLA